MERQAAGLLSPEDIWGEAAVISPHEFYNEALSRLPDDILDYEYRQWIASVPDTDATPPLLSMCQVPYLLDTASKGRLLLIEAQYQKHHEARAAQLSALAAGLPTDFPQWLFLRVRRSSVLEDTLEQVVRKSGDLKKPLRVTFVSGGVPEAGVDEGGVAKELFHVLKEELFDEAFGMFRRLESEYLWFDVRATEPTISYQLVGILLGLAIYNGHILDVKVPPAVYKKLLGHDVGFEDLKVAFPDLARGLQVHTWMMVHTYIHTYIYI